MPTNFDFFFGKKKYRSGVLYWVLELEESSAWLELRRGEAKARDGVPALLPAVPGGRLGSAARVLLLPTMAFPLPWRRLGMLLPLL